MYAFHPIFSKPNDVEAGKIILITLRICFADLTTISLEQRSHR